MGWTATASVGLTSAAGVAVATAAMGLVAVGGNGTMLRTWTMPLLAAISAPVTLALFTVIASASDTANSTWALLRVSTGPESISELGSAGPRTCLAISMAPHIMSEATSVDAYATLWRRWCHSLVGRMGTASALPSLCFRWG